MKKIKVETGLPRIIYIGNDKPVLRSIKFNENESGDLNVLYLDDDKEIEKYIILFNPDCIVTTGSSSEAYHNLMALPIDIRRRWINLSDDEKSEIGEIAYRCSMNYILSNQYQDMVSFFTPVYNTGEKLLRTYESVKNQTYKNWEWVIVNDSNDDGKTLKIAEELALKDSRIKVYDFKEKSGGLIGEVKHRAACMCNGAYLAELDHDDYLISDCAFNIAEAFEKYPDVGFVYSDCAEIDENWNSLTYPKGFGFGYGEYESQFVMGRIMSVYISMNINPKTIRHIVGIPNHIRVWRKSVYHKIGGHNRRLSIADDYELMVRTFLETKLLRIPKIGYLQFIYSNENEANTHDTARNDIQRRVRTIAAFYNEKIKERFEELGVKDWAYEENPMNPLLTESRFGDEEGYVNLIDDIKTKKIENVVNTNTDPEYNVRPELNEKIIYLTGLLNFKDEHNRVIDILDYERPEQVLNAKFLPPDAKVLEIGGRYGVASCFINRCLEEGNKKNHVVVEPDITVINALKHNRKANNCEFEIFNGTVSEQALSLVAAGSATRSQPDDTSQIEHMTYSEIQKKYQIEFDTLVVDCEGFFESFIDAFQEDMTNIKYIFLEYDFPNICNYDKIENILSKMGFHIEYQQFSQWHGLSCWHKIWIR